MGCRAAILGFSIAAAVTALNMINSGRFAGSKTYSAVSIFRIALLSAMISGIMIFSISVEPIIESYEKKHHDLFIAPVFAYTLPASIIAAFLYNFLMLSGYSIHFITKWGSFLLVLLAAVLSNITISLFPSPIIRDILTGVIFGAFPFAIFWFISAAIADPAFSYRRWEKAIRKEYEVKSK
jgi:hypothetical protein